jgi:DNA-binding transcriptional MocR family regulator
MLEGGRNSLRLAFSAVTPEEIDEGIKRLAEALESIKTPA